MVKAVAVAESDPARAEAWWRRFPFPLTREYMHSSAAIGIVKFGKGRGISAKIRKPAESARRMPLRRRR